MNKSELLTAIAEKTKLSKTDAEKVLNATTSIIIDKVVSGDKVTLVGFGTFQYAERKEREGRNPSTGAKLTIPAKKTPKFNPSKEFKERLNS